jgi:hypothetical protein
MAIDPKFEDESMHFLTMESSEFGDWSHDSWCMNENWCHGEFDKLLRSPTEYSVIESNEVLDRTFASNVESDTNFVDGVLMTDEKTSEQLQLCPLWQNDHSDFELRLASVVTTGNDPSCTKQADALASGKANAQSGSGIAANDVVCVTTAPKQARGNRGVHVRNRPDMHRTARAGAAHWLHKAQVLREAWEAVATVSPTFRAQFQPQVLFQNQNIFELHLLNRI